MNDAQWIENTADGHYVFGHLDQTTVGITARVNYTITPRLTVQMNRADPFDQFDGCGNGQFDVLSSGMVDAIYNLWNRNPVTVHASFLASNGAVDAPPSTKLVSY